MGRGHEGDDQRGPQFRDCARMVHKAANTLDKMPKGVEPKAKAEGKQKKRRRQSETRTD